MKSNWKRVFSSNYEYQAAIVEQALAKYAIPCVQMNKKDSAYTIGHVEVLVSQEDVLEAINIINKEVRFE